MVSVLFFLTIFAKSNSAYVRTSRTARYLLHDALRWSHPVCCCGLPLPAIHSRKHVPDICQPVKGFTPMDSRLYGRCSSKSCMVGDLKHLPSERRQTDASYHCHHFRPTDVRALDDGYLPAYVARPTSPAVAHLCGNGTLSSNIGHQYHHTQRDLWMVYKTV